MKKVLAWVLLLTLVLGAFAGCKKEETEPTEPAVTQPVDKGKVASANDAIEYLKGFYKDDGSQTPVDYTRFGIVRVGGVAFDVVWTVDVGEDLIKVVVNEDGTVTIDINEECPEDTEYVLTATVTDAQGNTVSHSWNYILPKAQDMVEIVKAAYALAPGESLPYESRLIGKIISIDTIWNDEYQNITVSIEITGAEDMPIKCYRMKGNDQTIEQIKDLKVGNIITVRGTLKNYEGTIEFDAGCILEKVEKGDAIDAPTDPGEILKAAYALPQDKALPYQATLTGTVIEIDTPYDPAYGNISVVIEVEGYPQYPILCYRLKGTGVDQIAIKDLITVTGIIKNYKGTIEYDAGCIMTERVSGGGVAQGPSSDAAKILADAAKLGVGEKLPYRATLTGEVYSVDTPYSSQYNNITVTMKVNGVKIQCYRMVGDGIDQIRETDTITVSGVIENYNGKLEFGKGCTLDSWSKGPRNVNYGPVVEDVAYRLYLDQTAIDKVLYFNGDVSGTRLQTSEKGSQGADVFAERVSGKGVRFFYMDGQTKTYIEIEEYLNDKGQARGRAIVTENPTCYWAYISDLGVYAVNLPTAGKYFLGSYSTYETITASWCGYIDGTMSGSEQFVAKFMKASDVPADDTPPVSGATGILVSEIQAGVPYKWGIDQKGLGSMLYFNGEMAKTYYGGTVENINAGVDVILEEVPGGGYYLSFTVNGAKKYVNVVVKVDGEKTHRNFAIDNSASTVYTYNSEHKTLITSVEGTDCYLGTYGTFNTFSISTLDKIGSSYPSHFYTVGEGGDTPVVPDEPGDGNEVVADPVAGTAYKFGMIQENVSTSNVYYITGEKANYYMATTTDAAAAADVYLEATNGGYYLYTIVNGAKKYINMVVSGTHVNGMFEDAASTVYTYDAEKQTVVATVNDALYWFGTRNDMTHTTMGPVKVEYNGFYAKFYAGGEGGSENPSEPEETEPDEDGIVAISEALKASSGTFTVKGVVTLVDSSNIYVQDSTGAICVRMSAKPSDISLGDTIIGTGSRADYNGMPQLGSGTYEKSSGMTLSAKETTIGALTTADICTYVKISGLTVTEVYDSNGTYSLPNITVEDSEGNSIQLYKAVVGKTNGAWDVKVGDTINVCAAVGYFNKFQLRNTLASEIAIGDAEPEAPTGPSESEPEETEPEEDDNIVAISEALKASSGTFTVKGVVTLVDSSNIYVQDSTGAICVRMAAKPTDISLGDTIIGTGSRADYNGMPQLGSGTYEKSSGMTLSAKETTIGALTTADICTYVKISGLTVTEVYDSNGTYSLPNITVKDSEGNTIQLYKAVVGKTNGAWDVKVGDTINVCAAVGYFNKFQLRNTVKTEIAIGDAEPDVPVGPSETEPEASAPDVSLPEDAEVMAVIFYDPATSVAMTALNETFTYGYLPETQITVTQTEAGVDVQGATEQNIFFMIDNGDETTVKIMDCYGRYLYMTGTYNSFNVSKEIPASGADWEPSLNETQDGMYLTNVATKKTVGYSAQHGSFGVYPEEEKHTALRLIQIVFEDEEQPEETEPEAGADTTVKYTFSNYGVGTQYVPESYDLDDNVSLDINGCHMNTQLRIYQDSKYDGSAIFTCAKTIKSLVINAGYKDATLGVYASTDGENWVLIEEVEVDGLNDSKKPQYADYTVEFPAGTSYKYLKLDAVNAQVRIPYITFTFGA